MYHLYYKLCIPKLFLFWVISWTIDPSRLTSGPKLNKRHILVWNGKEIIRKYWLIQSNNTSNIYNRNFTVGLWDWGFDKIVNDEVKNNNGIVKNIYDKFRGKLCAIYNLIFLEIAPPSTLKPTIETARLAKLILLTLFTIQPRSSSKLQYCLLLVSRMK